MLQNGALLLLKWTSPHALLTIYKYTPNVVGGLLPYVFFHADWY